MSKDTRLITLIVSSDWSVNVEDLKNVQFLRISLLVCSIVLYCFRIQGIVRYDVSGDDLLNTQKLRKCMSNVCFVQILHDFILNALK